MTALVLAAARMLPLAAVLPFGPPSVRLLLGGALTAVVALAMGEVAPLDSVSGRVAVTLAREAAVGLLLGLAASATLWGAAAAGAWADELRRSGVALRDGEGPMARLHRLLALALFAGLGGPALLLDAVGRSYAVLPARGGALVERTAAAGAAAVGAGLFTAAIELAAPLLVTSLLADLALGLVRRSAPSLTRGVGAPGGALARELVVLLSLLGGSAALVAVLGTRLLSVGDAVAAAARALAGAP